MRGRAITVGLLLIFILHVAGHAQIVNTLGGWDGSASGWSGEIGGTASLSAGNTDVWSVSGATQIQWRNDRHQLRFLARTEIEDANDERVKENSLGHVRHNHRLTTWLASLAFIQIQRDPFRRLETRVLIGAGARFDLLQRPVWSWSAGISPMLEREKIEDIDGVESRIRISTFVTLDARPAEGSAISLWYFLQPLARAPEDFRASGSISVKSRVVGRLSLLAQATHEHDDHPPTGVENDDWDLEFGFTVEL